MTTVKATTANKSDGDGERFGEIIAAVNGIDKRWSRRLDRREWGSANDRRDGEIVAFCCSAS